MTTLSDRALPENRLPVGLILLAVALCGLVLLFWDSLGFMIGSWRSLKHSHGFLVPFVVVALVCLQSRAHTGLALGGAARPVSAWIGPLLVLVGAGLLVFGELGAIYTISQCGFVLALWGVMLAATGFSCLRRVWLPLLCLLFIVPLPQFLANNLGALLQQMAVLPAAWLIRAAGFSVVVEGNLVDVGLYQIAVVEACSSVQIFLPLLSVALPAAVLYRGGWWWRVLLLLSAPLVPIAAGSLRLVVTGLLARYRGAGIAETFLFASGGPVLYLACAGLLLLLIWWAARSTGQTIGAAYGLSWPAPGFCRRFLWPVPAGAPLWVTVILVAAMLPASALLSRPELQLPERQRLAFFPRQIGEWQGHSAAVDPAALASLKLDDYLSLNYRRSAELLPVSLWVAWYDVQVYGAAIHSPMACLPGAGWRVDGLGIQVIPGAYPGGQPLRVNRAIITRGAERQLVYYWFVQRGRNLTSEYLLKWYIFQDGLLMQRSDGALIRLTTWLPDLAATKEADARLIALVQAITPLIADYAPGAEVRLRGPWRQPETE